TSEYCMIKCYEKVLNLVLNRTGIHKYAASLRSMKQLLIRELVNCDCEKRHERYCRQDFDCNCPQIHTPECKELIDETLAQLPVLVKYGRMRGKLGFHRISKNIYKNESQAI